MNASAIGTQTIQRLQSTFRRNSQNVNANPSDPKDHVSIGSRLATIAKGAAPAVVYPAAVLAASALGVAAQASIAIGGIPPGIWLVPTVIAGGIAVGRAINRGVPNGLRQVLTAGLTMNCLTVALNGSNISAEIAIQMATTTLALAALTCATRTASSDRRANFPGGSGIGFGDDGGVSAGNGGF